MAVYGYHEHPDVLRFDTAVVAGEAGRIMLARSFLHPGGGGQVSDQARILFAEGEARIVDVAHEAGCYWHILDRPIAVAGDITVEIDASHRLSVSRLHTVTHILNALVFQRFDGALVTGAQIYADGTARMDFDLPDADNDELRKLEPRINEIIAAGIEVRASWISHREALATPGLIRSLSVAPPPTPDGRIRIIEIAGVDRQACGGTHLTNTAQSAPIRITKVENKGRRNRRVKVALL
ncbi:MAG: alanyl-tRNA editing protein [Gammaproteobacteria bacterium]|nr:alanyl-tRNA editing protein [Gammaproteobacteria bacterium]